MGGFLERLAGTGIEDVPEAQSGLGALFGGFAKGLGSAGSRIAKQRQQFEQASAKRRAQTDAERLEATRARRQALFSELNSVRGEERTAKREAAKYERDNPKPGTPEYRVGLQRIEDERAATARGDARVPKTGGEDAAVQLSPAGLDAAATMYGRTGTLPPMGIGKATAGVRTRIINRAAEIFPDLNIAGNKAAFETDKQALGNLKKIHQASSAFEKTALKNADVLEGTLQRIVDSGSPWINRPLRALSRGVGDPDIIAFRTALETVAPEFARLLNSPTASGQLSDTAREEIRHILDPNATPRQIKAALGILRQDAHNRTSSYAAQIAELEGSIAGRKAVEPGTAESRTKPDYHWVPGQGLVPAGSP
jgi:hypothetical protein